MIGFIFGMVCCIFPYRETIVLLQILSLLLVRKWLFTIIVFLRYAGTYGHKRNTRKRGKSAF